MSDDDEELKKFTDKIVRPDFGGGARVLETQDDPRPMCMHGYIQLFPRSKRVFCRSCRKELDAFDVLRDLAREWATVTWLNQDQEKLRVKIDELKAEEQRIKARIRNGRNAGERPDLIQTYFTELVARLNAIESHGELYKIDQWRLAFQWLTPEQNVVIKDAAFRAKQRCEANARKSRPGRRVRVLDGGKGTR